MPWLNVSLSDNIAEQSRYLYEFSVCLSYLFFLKNYLLLMWEA